MDEDTLNNNASDNDRRSIEDIEPNHSLNLEMTRKVYISLSPIVWTEDSMDWGYSNLVRQTIT